MPMHHHRHESQKQKRAKAQMRIARTHAHELRSERTDTPSPLTDIGIDRISELIRSVTGTFDDAFQEAWATVLGDHVACEEDILRIAKECRRKQVSEEYTINHRISLDAPAFKESDQSDGASPPLSEYTAAPSERTEEEINQAIEEEERLRKCRKLTRPNKTGRITLSQDVLEAIQKVYPHDSLNVAIKKLAAKPIDGKLPYALWEDAIVKKMYPWGGGKAVRLMLNRSLDSISTRAKALGIKRILHGSPPMDYVVIKKMCNLLETQAQAKREQREEAQAKREQREEAQAKREQREAEAQAKRKQREAEAQAKREHMRRGPSGYSLYQMRWCHWIYKERQFESISDFLRLLHTDETLMKECFFERLRDIPSQPTFSRIFAKIEGREIGQNTIPHHKGKPYAYLSELEEAYSLYKTQSLSYTEITERINIKYNTNIHRTTISKFLRNETGREDEWQQFKRLLDDLCMGIPQPPQTFGRPRLALPKAVFTIVARIYSTMSGRRFTSALYNMQEPIGRASISMNSSFRYLGSPELTPILKQIIEVTSQPLKEIETDFTTDPLLLSTLLYDHWYDENYGGRLRKEARMVEALLTSGIKTHVVTDVKITLVETTSTPKIFAATKSTTRNLHIRKAYIETKLQTQRNGLWNHIWRYYTSNRVALIEHCPQYPNVETTPNMIKRKFGRSIKSKTPTAQVNEVLCKVLCHNICVLIQSIYELKLEPVFLESPRECTREEEPCA